jgi:hypothetical protein
LLVVIVISYVSDGPMFDSRHVQEIILFSETSRQLLGPIHTSTQFIPVRLRGIHGRGDKAAGAIYNLALRLTGVAVGNFICAKRQFDYKM